MDRDIAVKELRIARDKSRRNGKIFGGEAKSPALTGEVSFTKHAIRDCQGSPLWAFILGMSKLRSSSSRGKVNMRMIAKKAGVSTTTVSLALRDDPSISPPTKSRIRVIQKELGYQPAVRRVRRSSQAGEDLDQIIYRVVGVDIHEDTYVPFLNGVSRECSRRSIKLEFESGMDRNFGVDTRPAKNSDGAGRRGLILTGTLDQRHIDAARNSGLPFIVLGNYTFKEPAHSAAIDLMDAAQSMVQTLHLEGMQKLAIVVEDSKENWERHFLRYLRGTFLDLGHAMEDEILIETGKGFSKAGEAAEKILRHARLGLKVLTLEPHCAQHLFIEIQARRNGSVAAVPLFSFGDKANATNSHRHYRLFDIGKHECAKLAVIRLMELYRHPDTPVCTSVIPCPGWV